MAELWCLHPTDIRLHLNVKFYKCLCTYIVYLSVTSICRRFEFNVIQIIREYGKNGQLLFSSLLIHRRKELHALAAIEPSHRASVRVSGQEMATI